ncbi:MAG: Lon protease [Candidatus Levybacteria bacterium GW2011_GWA2_40_8]|nr:MAG: Lon protease [Candidatus Levybacteria bacterium GW2011_GWA2_40_8]
MDIPKPALESLREKLKKTEQQLPPDLLEKAESLLSVSDAASLESLSRYIEILTLIPFDNATEDTLDINRAKQVLDKNHYALSEVKDRILEYLSSLILNLEKGRNSSETPILCLVGLAGTGKTTLASSMAESLGRIFERIPFGGIGDVTSVRGQSRSLPNAEPGLIVKKLIHAKSKNPVILLDEIDRVVDVSRADIMGVFLEVLDPAQNMAFLDHYVDYPIDLSKVLFVATANNTTNISTAVLDRLEVIQMPSYSDEEKMSIGKNYLFPKIVERCGLDKGQIVFDETAWQTIIRPLGFDSGIRSLERTLEGIARKVARKIVEGSLNKNAIIRIDSTNVKEFIA